MKHSSFKEPMPFYSGCFVCGNENNRGLRCRFFKEGQEATAILRTEPWMVGYEGIVHGGIIGTVLDEALIWGAYAATGRFGMTAEITIRFLHPLYVASTCAVVGKLKENKGKIWIVEGWMVFDNKTEIAKAEGKVLPMKPEQEEAFKAKLAYFNE